MPPSYFSWGGREVECHQHLSRLKGFLGPQKKWWEFYCDLKKLFALCNMMQRILRVQDTWSGQCRPVEWVYNKNKYLSVNLEIRYCVLHCRVGLLVIVKKSPQVTDILKCCTRDAWKALCAFIRKRKEKKRKGKGELCFNLNDPLWFDFLFWSFGYGLAHVLSMTSLKHGERGGAVSWLTALQAGKSRVRFPVVSLEFFIDIFLPAAL